MVYRSRAPPALLDSQQGGFSVRNKIIKAKEVEIRTKGRSPIAPAAAMRRKAARTIAEKSKAALADSTPTQEQNTATGYATNRLEKEEVGAVQQSGDTVVAAGRAAAKKLRERAKDKKIREREPDCAESPPTDSPGDSSPTQKLQKHSVKQRQGVGHAAPETSPNVPRNSTARQAARPTPQARREAPVPPSRQPKRPEPKQFTPHSKSKTMVSAPRQKPYIRPHPVIKSPAVSAAQKATVAKAQKAALTMGGNPSAWLASMKKAIQAIAARLQSLVAALCAGGAIMLFILILICLIALLSGSALGIFFGMEDSDQGGISIPQAVEQLNTEFYDAVREITEDVAHDRQEIVANDDVYYIPWQDILAVFSSKVSGDAQGSQVAVLDEELLDTLRTVMNDMNRVDWHTRTESHEVEVPAEPAPDAPPDAEPGTTTITVTETILVIEYTHKTPEDMADTYHFNARQNEYLALMQDPAYSDLWAQLLGGFQSGGGGILTPGGGWQSIGALGWPLPIDGSISSHFGFRYDPITGEAAYHNGTDIVAPEGTEILAAADGTVSIANGIDPWGGSYGYYIKIDHGGLQTLYAHCSAICVTLGQQVQAGEVIGYVGRTGNSTGNHLHFEVYENGARQDALNYFTN